jgi:phage-related minor tail protein
MTLDEIKRQFVEQVKLRAYDDKYIDKGEEREILQIALQNGVTVDSARAALAQVCEANGYVLESRILQDIKQTIEVAAGNDGKVDEKEFNDAVALLKLTVQNQKNDVQC